MTTTQKIDAYCAALKARLRGERVEWRIVGPWDKWDTFDGEAFDPNAEYRIASPAPPKLREFAVEPESIGPMTYTHKCYEYDGGRLRSLIHVREVSAEADAEIAEKLHNHDALVRAIGEWFDERGDAPYPLRVYLDKHGAKLP
jgi:hypothetical protein